MQGIWTRDGYKGELVLSEGGFSLWKVGKLYYHVRGVSDESFFGGFEDDASAIEAWSRLVSACKAAWGGDAGTQDGCAAHVEDGRREARLARKRRVQ